MVAVKVVTIGDRAGLLEKVLKCAVNPGDVYVYFWYGVCEYNVISRISGGLWYHLFKSLLMGDMTCTSKLET